jgi:hypothetical protein
VSVFDCKGNHLAVVRYRIRPGRIRQWLYRLRHGEEMAWEHRTAVGWVDPSHTKVLINTVLDDYGMPFRVRVIPRRNVLSITALKLAP